MELPPPPRRGRDRRGAFTLVELLTIIVILGMLISLAMPSIVQAMKVYRVRESRIYFDQIMGGITLYKNDWKRIPPTGGWASGFPDYLKGLPPSNDGAVGTNLMGAQALVQALLGYRDEDHDGKAGLGARSVERGKVYGPYVSGQLPTVSEGGKLSFHDAFGNRILYYRFEPGSGSAGGRFLAGHNDFDAGSDNSIATDAALAAYLTDPNDQLYRRDYVVISPGPDRAWKKPADQKTDDLTNFQFWFE